MAGALAGALTTPSAEASNPMPWIPLHRIGTHWVGRIVSPRYTSGPLGRFGQPLIPAPNNRPQ